MKVYISCNFLKYAVYRLYLVSTCIQILLVFTKPVQHRRRRGIKRRPRQGRRKVQDAVVLARRIAHKHALQHLLNDPQAARVADEVGAKDAGAGRAKGHVVAQDAVLVAVGVLDGGERLVRLLVAVGLVVELHVVQLGAADDGLLGFC